MAAVITTFIILVCILLILVVLIQNSKGGGLSSQFAGSNQIMGVRRTADFLEKATYTLAIALLVLSLFSSANFSKAGTGGETTNTTSELKNKQVESPNSKLQNNPTVQPPATNSPEPGKKPK